MKKNSNQKSFFKKKKASPPSIPSPVNLENLRLNKFMAHGGVGTRRECEVLIKKGLVKVNDEVVTEAAYRVQKNDVVKYEGKVIQIDKKYVYVLLNKPKGYPLSFEKIEGEKTLQNIFADKIKVKISPVGTMEKESMGLLVLTDDDVLVEKYAQPDRQLKEVYHIILKAPIQEDALQKIQKKAADSKIIKSISHVKDKGKEEIGVEMKWKGDTYLRNFFEKSGHPVAKIDRMSLGGLTKKDLPRGWFRLLTEKEVIFLKHFG